MSCNEDQSQARSASDYSTYNWLTSIDLLLNNSHTRAVLFRFYHTLKIDKMPLIPSDSLNLQPLFDKTLPTSLAVTSALTSICNDASRWCIWCITLFCPVICCRIKHSTFPLPIYRLSRHFAWNVKSLFLGKIRKIFLNVFCWNFYPLCKVLNKIFILFQIYI